MGPRSDLISFLIKRESRELDVFLSLHMQRRSCEYTASKAAVWKPGRDSHQKLNWLAPWYWTSWPLELGEINVCYLNYPVYGMLLWQREQTTTFSACLTTRAPSISPPNSHWSSQWLFIFCVPFSNACFMLAFTASLVATSRKGARCLS